MTEPSNDEPQALWLERDVALWLHTLADKYYDGDLQRVMNACLRAVMVAEAQPDDPWAAVSWQAQDRSRG